MVYYTAKFRNSFPNVEEMNTYIDLVFLEANQGYENSNFPMYNKHKIHDNHNSHNNHNNQNNQWYYLLKNMLNFPDLSGNQSGPIWILLMENNPDCSGDLSRSIWRVLHYSFANFYSVR